ncbi:MAG: rhomboid family intramembrane serine protease [Beutenbergiaceae bacterium]
MGVHCIDCVKQAEQGGRAQVTVFGAKVRRGRPVVTITLIAICVVLYLLDWVTPLPRYLLTFTPAVGAVEPWRMLTTAFLHAPGTYGIMHIGFNMMALWFTGPFLERAFGRLRFLALYLTSALGGSVAVLLLTPLVAWNIGTVGASGAVFGLFGAVAVVMARMKVRNNSILSVIAINLVLTFLIPNISWQAHLGGLVTGAAVAALYAYVPKRWQVWGAVAGVGAILLVLVVATVLRYLSVLG